MHKSAGEVIWTQDFAKTGCIDALTARENHHLFPELSNGVYKEMELKQRGMQRRKIRQSVNIRRGEKAKGQRLPADSGFVRSQPL